VTERLFDLLDLPRAAVSAEATLADAARELFAHPTGAIAVLDAERVVGVLGEDDLLRAIFPPYLGELTHTAFVQGDELLGPHLERAASMSVAEFARKAETVELPTSALDVAQRFLHSDASALIATRDGKFVGVIDQSQFCKAILGRHGWQL
jgi:CBS domain-containing protein